jgi:hypothetical protein
LKRAFLLIDEADLVFFDEDMDIVKVRRAILAAARVIAFTGSEMKMPHTSFMEKVYGISTVNFCVQGFWKCAPVMKW